MPESLSAAEMQRRRAARAEERRAMGSGTAGWAKRVASSLDIVSPLSVLLPKKVEHGTRTGTDWTMPVLGAAYGFGTFVQVCRRTGVYHPYSAAE